MHQSLSPHSITCFKDGSASEDSCSKNAGSCALNKHQTRRRTRAPTLPAQPSPHDVICSQDRTYVKHPGNILFRELIESHLAAYMNATTKQQKMCMTRGIVHQLQSEYGSKFLRPKRQAWQVISESMARDKISHAMRFAAKTKRRRIAAQEAAHSLERLADDTQHPDDAVIPMTPGASVRPVESLFQRQRAILQQHLRDQCVSEESSTDGNEESVETNSEIQQEDLFSRVTPDMLRDLDEFIAMM